MSSLDQNPDLSLGMVRPGVYVAVNLQAPGGGVDDVSKRALILAYKQASGSAPIDSPFQAVALKDVSDACGAKSDCARGFNAMITQVGAGNIDIFVCPLLEPSGGTASTYKLIFASTALSPGSVDVTVDGRAILSVGFSTGDTSTIIAAAVKLAIDNLSDAPCTASVASSTVTLTYPHKGAVGEDCPIRANVNGTGTAITASPGSLLFANSAVGAGSVLTTICGITVTTPLVGGETPAQVATKVVASFAAGSYPLTAAVNGFVPELVDFFFVKGRDYRHMTVTIAGSTGLTADVTSQGAVGAGTPTLTAALSNLSGLQGFSQWATPFVGTQASPDTATLGTIATHIETQADGVKQKEQRVHAGAAWPSATLGTIPTATSPALTASPRYALVWAQDWGNQAFEVTCRIAAARAANDYPPKNWDGYQLKGSATCPLVLPATGSQPSGDTINSAMRSYYLCPVIVNPATNTAIIEKATTTSNSSYQPLRDFATIDQIAFWRRDLATHLADTFGGLDAKQLGIPKTPNTITASSVAQEMYMQALGWDERDLYDGAESLKAGFKAKFNQSNPTRIDASFPMSPVINVHQIGVVGNLVPPSLT